MQGSIEQRVGLLTSCPGRTPERNLGAQARFGHREQGMRLIACEIPSCGDVDGWWMRPAEEGINMLMERNWCPMRTVVGLEGAVVLWHT